MSSYAQTSSNGKLCLVTNRGAGAGGDTVSVISFRRRRQIARLHTGDGPQEIIVGAIRDRVLRRAGLLPAARHRAKRH